MRIILAHESPQLFQTNEYINIIVVFYYTCSGFEELYEWRLQRARGEINAPRYCTALCSRLNSKKTDVLPSFRSAERGNPIFPDERASSAGLAIRRRVLHYLVPTRL